jgi:hypothetical protein
VGQLQQQLASHLFGHDLRRIRSNAGAVQIENWLPTAEGVVRPARHPVGAHAAGELQRVALHLPQLGLGRLAAGREGTVREQVAACRLCRGVPRVAGRDLFELALRYSQTPEASAGVFARAT